MPLAATGIKRLPYVVLKKALGTVSGGRDHQGEGGRADSQEDATITTYSCALVTMLAVKADVY